MSEDFFYGTLISWATNIYVGITLFVVFSLVALFFILRKNLINSGSLWIFEGLEVIIAGIFGAIGILVFYCFHIFLVAGFASVIVLGFLAGFGRLVTWSVNKQ